MQDTTSGWVAPEDGWEKTPFKNDTEAVSFLEKARPLEDTEAWEYYGEKPEFSWFQTTPEGKQKFHSAWAEELPIASQLAEAERGQRIPSGFNEYSFSLRGRDYNAPEGASFDDGEFGFARSLLKKGWKLVDSDRIRAPDGTELSLHDTRDELGYGKYLYREATMWNSPELRKLAHWAPAPIIRGADIPSYAVGRYDPHAILAHMTNADYISPVPSGTQWSDTVFGTKGNFINPHSRQWKNFNGEWLSPKGKLLAGNRSSNIRTFKPISFRR